MAVHHHSKAIDTNGESKIVKKRIKKHENQFQP